MSERRRSVLVLLVVLGLIAGSVYAITSRETTLGLDLKGGVQLVYQAEPTAQQPTVTQEALARSRDLMRERVDAFGVAEPELLLAGENQIEVNLPGVEDAERAAEQVGSTAQLFFYDWEANLLDEDCRTDPDENSNARRPITGFFNAVETASKCEAQVDDNNSAADGPRFYAFDEETKEALNNGAPSDSREAALEDLSDEERAGAQVIEVPEGILVVRDEKPRADAPDPDRYWLVQDNPALSGTDIRNPEQNFDQRTNEPIVTFDFTDKGREAFQRITAAIAERGLDNALPGDIPSNSSQHFAIVLDNELVSAPHINYQENPGGIDGSTGAQISGGFTISSAQDLAKILEIGALPLRLDLVSRSQVSASLGAQALDQGLTAGLAGFLIVALFLISFYRVLGVIATVAMVIYGLYFYALVELILFILATAGVKGFAFMLGLGVIVSLFTAVLATQAILFSLRGTRLIRSRAALGASDRRFSWRLNYMGASRWFFSASGVIMLCGALAIAGNGLNFGIDFEGGTRITAPLEQAANVEQVRDVVRGAGLD